MDCADVNAICIDRSCNVVDIMKPYRILQARYDPPRWSAWRIGRYITDLTESLGLVPLVDPNHSHQTKAAWCDTTLCAYVRRRTVKNPKAAQWHQDGDLTGGIRDSSIVTWTSNTSTEVKGFDGTLYKIPKRAIVLIRNNDCLHRRPPNAPRVRYLFRQRVENES